MMEYLKMRQMDVAEKRHVALTCYPCTLHTGLTVCFGQQWLNLVSAFLPPLIDVFHHLALTKIFAHIIPKSFS